MKKIKEELKACALHMVVLHTAPQAPVAVPAARHDREWNRPIDKK